MPWDMWWVIIPAIVLLVLAYRSRVWRIITFVIAVLAVFLFPIIAKGISAVSTNDTSIIRNYDLDYTVAANGDLDLVETLDVQFTEDGKHGIYRFFDPVDGVDPSVSHPITVESVKHCTDNNKCVSEPYKTYEEDGLLVAKIGSGSVTYDAGTVNRYVITSSTTDAITQPSDATTPQFYWDVIGQGWNMPIKKSTVSVTLPAKPTDVRCITDSGACTTTTDGRTVTGSYTNLPVRTPITWQADLPAEGLSVTPVTVTGPWWSSPTFWLVSLLMGAAIALLIWLHRERKSDDTPVFAAPTNDILPAVWTYREESPDKGFQILLLQLAQLGALRIEVDPDGQYAGRKPQWFTIHRTDAALPTGVSGAPELVSSLSLTTPSSSKMITKSDTTVGSTLQSLGGTLTTIAETQARAAGYFTKSKTGAWTNFIAALLPIASIVCTVMLQKTAWGAALLIPAFVGLFSSRTQRTRLTKEGAAMRDQVTGLRTALSTPASVERFDYSLRAQYFAQFLPWAVALDCADKWAEACKPPPGTEPGSSGYDPTYAAAWSTYSLSDAVSVAAGSVSAGAVSAYAATQSSSSSGGGGGFSSGGGSGGGGGGSW
ncbi:MAG: DUF2207 domain-containing protein [Candidatus Nanopelagicales bacterium]